MADQPRQAVPGDPNRGIARPQQTEKLTTEDDPDPLPETPVEEVPDLPAEPQPEQDISPSQ